MIIDINDIIKNIKPGIYSETYYSYIPRKIVSIITAEKIKNIQDNNIYSNKVIIGSEIFYYLSNESIFNYNPYHSNFNVSTNGNELIENLGYALGLEFFKDNTYTIKENEFIFFDNENELSFVKNYLRKQKINRLI